MGLKTWLRDFLGNKTIEIDPVEFFRLSSDAAYRELALSSAINLIGRAVSKTEFKTYREHSPVKSDEYWLWNVSPNNNQSSSAFLQKLISRLYRSRDGALVVCVNNKLLVADDFSVERFALYDYRFSGVTVDDLVFDRPFTMSDVMFFQQNNQNVSQLLDSVYASYGRLISYAQKAYQQSRGRKGIMKISATAQGRPEFQDEYSAYVNGHMKKFFEADSAVLPVFDGYEYNDITTGNTRAGLENSRDIRAQIDDVFDFTARLLGIPPALLQGEKLEVGEIVDNFLTFCIEPLCDTLQEEITRKRYSRAEYLAGTYLQIDTSTIKHVDIISSASNIDKLFGSGWSFNQIVALCGRERVDEPWADEHMITKNYAPAEDVLRAAGGGESE